MDGSMLEMLKAIVKEEDDIIAGYYLASAKKAVLNRAYPYNPEIESVPVKYEQTVIEIAVYLYNKAGAEGETAHNENGINRTYESAGIPFSMLRDVIPYVGVVKKDAPLKTEHADS